MILDESHTVAPRLNPGFTARADMTRAGVPMTDDLLVNGSLRMGVLSLLADMTGGFLSQRSVLPHWVTTWR